MRTVRKVLVVDDDPVVGRSFDRVLSEKGYEVSTALSGVDAMQKLARDDYDVVYTDIKMPGMDGLEVAGRVKASRPWVPVVIITGYGTAANEARAQAIGVADFLRKPLSPEMIEGSARKALRVIEGGAQKAVPKEAAVLTAPQAAEVAVELPPAAAVVGTAKGVGLFVKNVVLFFAAPFIGLAYAVAFPFVGLALLVRLGVRELVKRAKAIAFFANSARVLKNIALFIAAPFVGLAYAIAFPFIGLGMLAWIGIRALVKRSAPE